MLFTRLQWDADGQPRIPGNLDIWKQVLAEKSEPKLAKDWGRRARGWKRPEQLLEAMAAMSRIDTDLGPLQVYLMLNEVDSRRPADKRLTPETALLLASKFSQLSNWYLVFSEFPDLDDTSIKSFVKVADSRRRHLQPQPARKRHGHVPGQPWDLADSRSPGRNPQ